MRSTILAASAAMALAASAGAVTTISSVPGPDGAGQTILFNFNTPGSGATGLSGNYAITTGTTAQLAAAPLMDTTPYLVVPGLGMGTSGTATLNLGQKLTNLSFYWGSIDTYNTVSFYSGANGGGTLLGSYTGAQVPGATANGAQGTTANNRRVFFDFGGFTAQSVVFNSTAIAFELDDVATAAVPEPTVWATLLTGFGLIGISMRRRRIISLTA